MERPVESQTAPERLESPIHPKILLLILGLVIAFELYVTSLQKGEADTPITAVSIALPTMP